VKSTTRWTNTTYVQFLAFATMCGCGLAPGDPGGAQQLGTASEALGETTCFTTAAYDVKACTGCPTTQPIGWTSPQTYSHPDCYKAVIADVLNYSPIYSGPGDESGGIYVSWADAIPTTQSACVSAWIHADLYVSGGTKIGSKSAVGQWFPAGFFVAHCAPPSVSFTTEIPLFSGYTGIYRTVASARTSSSSSAPTRTVRIEQRMPVVVK
jgi:hypothetical protein